MESETIDTRDTTADAHAGMSFAEEVPFPERSLTDEIRTYQTAMAAALTSLYNSSVIAAFQEQQLVTAMARAELTIRKRIASTNEKATENSIRAEVVLEPTVQILEGEAQQARNTLLHDKLAVEALDATRRSLAWLVNLTVSATTDI